MDKVNLLQDWSRWDLLDRVIAKKLPFCDIFEFMLSLGEICSQRSNEIQF